MSCLCYSGGECIISKVRGPHTARKAGHECGCCGVSVAPGTPCIDHVGIRDDGTGWFSRYHIECWRAMEEYGDHYCGGEYAMPMDLDEAAQNVLADKDQEWQRKWLLLFEATWKYGAPLKPDPVVWTCEDCIRFAWCQRTHGVTRLTMPCKLERYSFEAVRGEGFEGEQG